jgi:hypothetical protein
MAGEYGIVRDVEGKNLGLINVPGRPWSNLSGYLVSELRFQPSTCQIQV